MTQQYKPIKRSSRYIDPQPSTLKSRLFVDSHREPTSRSCRIRGSGLQSCPFLYHNTPPCQSRPLAASRFPTIDIQRLLQLSELELGRHGRPRPVPGFGALVSDCALSATKKPGTSAGLQYDDLYGIWDALGARWLWRLLGILARDQGGKDARQIVAIKLFYFVSLQRTLELIGFGRALEPRQSRITDPWLRLGLPYHALSPARMKKDFSCP